MSFFPVNLEHPREFARFLLARRTAGPEPSKSLGLDQHAGEQFLELLKLSKGYLEFGSGGSTYLAAELGIATLSVEADRLFAEAVRRSLPRNARVEVMIVDLGFTREWSRPVFTAATRSRLRRWRAYSRAPFYRLQELGWFPDVVLVDGRFRRACALQTAREALKRRCTVTLVVDDYFLADRQHYHSIEHWLGVPERFGRAAFFEVAPGKTMEPASAAIHEAACDYE